MASRPTVTQVRFRLREDLLAKLRRAADANDRSLNEEVELRLLDSLTKDTVAKTVKATTAELIKETAEATAHAWVDTPIEAELARGGKLTVGSFPRWMLVDWAKRHPEHPEAARIREWHEKWMRQGEPYPEQMAEAERFANERLPRSIRKAPRGRLREK
jgi:hypothetical protein